METNLFDVSLRADPESSKGVADLDQGFSVVVSISSNPIENFQDSKILKEEFGEINDPFYSDPRFVDSIKHKLSNMRQGSPNKLAQKRESGLCLFERS